jgi:hypothetical protein
MAAPPGRRQGWREAGLEDAEDEAVTDAASFPMAADQARRLFDRAKVELGSEANADLVVDLMVNGDLIDAFYLHRQMLPRLAALCGASVH